MTFGEKLRSIRNKRGFSQKELCEKVGISLRTLTGWESEGRHPKKREIYFKLAELLSCDVNYFLTEDLDCSPDEGNRQHDNAYAILEQAKALFAGNLISDKEKLQFLSDMQMLFLNSKNDNK